MIWMQTNTGKAFDLISPDPGMVDFAGDVAPALARSGRFAGHVPAGIYSVAQHCVLGCDALFDETGKPELAAAFLLHDAHEAYVGDITQPVAQALAEICRLMLGESRFRMVLGALKGRIDEAIFAAAGLAAPTAPIREAVHAMDMRMLKAERDHLCAAPPQPWHEAVEQARPVRLRGRISLWPWPYAADQWLRRLRTYCPHAAGL